MEEIYVRIESKKKVSIVDNLKIVDKNNVKEDLIEIVEDTKIVKDVKKENNEKKDKKEDDKVTFKPVH